MKGSVRGTWVRAVPRGTLAVLLATCALYAGSVLVGLRLRDLSGWMHGNGPRVRQAWTLPARSGIPRGALGDSIRLGESIFNETPLYAAAHTGAKISCSSCHAEGGTQRLASPMIGVPAVFPQFNARAGHVISLEDRVQECFVRSENGRPLDYKGTEMKAVVDYIGWVSKASGGGVGYKGRGLVDLPELTPDTGRGAAIYAAQCAGCHGGDGRGRAPMFPALWGPDSFNDGAGMHGVKKMAGFVQHNMPQNRMGSLSAQEAYDVAGFIHAQPRPAFDKAYAKY